MRLPCIRFSLLSTAFSLSLSLLYGFSEWKRPLYFSLWMIRLDELVKVKSIKVNSQKVIIQDEG